QQTVGYVAQHLEDANYQLCAPMNGDKRTMTAKDSLADTVKAMWPKDTLTARLKASFAYCDAAISRVEDSKLADQMPAGPPGSGRTVPRAVSPHLCDGSRGPLQPDRELHATQQHGSAVGAAAAASGELKRS